MAEPASLGGMPHTASWRVLAHFNFIYEIEADQVAHLLPRELSLREPRAGMALLNVGYMRYPPGELGGKLPAFEEITFSLLVNPDLSLDTAMPRLCVYDFRIGSDCRAFLDFERDHQSLNGYLAEGFHSEINERKDELTVRDSHGPIFTMRNTHPKPAFKDEVAVGQYYSTFEGGLYQGVFLWDGRGCEHQREGDFGRLHNHPFFREVDVERGVTECFMQMFLDPATGVTFGSFSPRRLR